MDLLLEERTRRCFQVFGWCAAREACSRAGLGARLAHAWTELRRAPRSSPEAEPAPPPSLARAGESRDGLAAIIHGPPAFGALPTVLTTGFWWCPCMEGKTLEERRLT